MLGVVETPVEGPADELLRQVADELGVGSTYARTPVGDPLRRGRLRRVRRLHGRLPLRREELDRPDLPAPRGGARRARAAGDRGDAGRAARRRGLRGRDAAAGAARRRAALRARTGRARGRHARDAAAAAALRASAGRAWGAACARTPSRSSARPRAGRPADFTRGVAIGSSLALDEHTTVEAVRYPRGSNAMGLLGTILPDEPGARGFARTALRRPHLALASLSVRRWSERTVIFLVMQSRPGELTAVLRDGKLTTEGGRAPVTGSAEAAHLVARTAARLIRGFPGGSLNEALLGIPMTAHVLGGATEEHGVIDGFGRVLSASRPARRRRRRGRREPRREPVADDRRAGRARARGLAGEALGRPRAVRRQAQPHQRAAVRAAARPRPSPPCDSATWRTIERPRPEPGMPRAAGAR